MNAKWWLFYHSFYITSWHSTKEQAFPSPLLFIHLLLIPIWAPGFLFYLIVWYYHYLFWCSNCSNLASGNLTPSGWLLCPFDKSSSFWNFSNTVQFPFNNFALFNNSLFSFLQKISPLWIPLLVINEKWHTKKGIF